MRFFAYICLYHTVGELRKLVLQELKKTAQWKARVRSAVGFKACFKFSRIWNLVNRTTAISTVRKFSRHPTHSFWRNRLQNSAQSADGNRPCPRLWSGGKQGTLFFFVTRCEGAVKWLEDFSFTNDLGYLKVLCNAHSNQTQSRLNINIWGASSSLSCYDIPALFLFSRLTGEIV